jgi:ribosomal protein L34
VEIRQLTANIAIAAKLIAVHFKLFIESSPLARPPSNQAREDCGFASRPVTDEGAQVPSRRRPKGFIARLSNRANSVR